MHSSNASQLEPIFPKIPPDISCPYRLHTYQLNSYFLRRVVKKLIKYTRLLMHSSKASKLVREDSQLYRRDPTNRTNYSQRHSSRRWFPKLNQMPRSASVREWTNRTPRGCAPRPLFRMKFHHGGSWWFEHESRKRKARIHGGTRRGPSFLSKGEPFFPFAAFRKTRSARLNHEGDQWSGRERVGREARSHRHPIVSTTRPYLFQ